MITKKISVQQYAECDRHRGWQFEIQVSLLFIL